MAMRFGLRADQLRDMRYTYPSHSDDISYIVLKKGFLLEAANSKTSTLLKDCGMVQAMELPTVQSRDFTSVNKTNLVRFDPAASGSRISTLPRFNLFD
jgi:hypothetical protein